MKKTLVAAIIFFSTYCYSQVSFIEPIIKNNNGRAVTAGFVIIKSDENLLINKISSNISKRIEIHSMKMENDVMKMRKIEEPKIEKNKEFILLVLNIIIDARIVINPYKNGEEISLSKCIMTSLEE